MKPGRIFAWRWFLALSALAGFVRGQSAAGPSDLSTFEGRTIQRLTIQSDGPLTALSYREALKLLTLRESQPFTQSNARRSIQRLHATRVFHDIQVAAQEAGAAVDVVITLIRKYDVSEIDFSGSLQLSKESLRRVVPVRAGDPYSAAAVEEGVRSLRQLYRLNGYYRAEVRPEFELDQERARLRVRFAVQAGPKAVARSVNLEVTGGLEREEIVRQLGFGPGDPFSEADLNARVEEISASLVRQGYLDALVYVREGPTYQSEENSIDATVRVVPRQKTKVRFAGAEPDAEILRDLPLFVERSSAPVFLEESAAALQNRYQRQGYLMAQVGVAATPPTGAPEEIVFEIDRGDKLSVGAVEFSGNRSVDSAALARLVSVRKSGFFSRGRLTRDLLSQDLKRVQSYYQQRGFLDVQAKTELRREGKKVVVGYVIDEGERYLVSAFEVVGVEKIDRSRLDMEIQLREGAPFAPLQAARDRANVIAYYENLGYRQVDFRSEIKPAGPRMVSVRYIIREGPRLFIDEVVVTGNRATRKRVINRELAIAPGAPLSLGAILETEANLYGLAVFNRVQINEAPSYEDPDRKTVVVHVEEAKRYTLVYGIGYSSFEGPRGTVGVTNNNFLGLARTVSLGLRVGETRQRANLSYSLPRVFGRRLPTVLSFTADNEKAQTTRTVGPSRAIRGRPFDAFRLIGSTQTERRLSRRESLFFRYRFEDVTLDIPANLASPLEFFREEENLRLSSLSVSYLNESRDDPSEPSRGFFATGDILASSRFIGSEAELLRFFGQAQYYRGLGRGIVWASSVRLGMIAPYARSETVPISERFFSGGATTLRGLPQDLAGPLLRDSKTGEVILVDDQGRLDPNGRPVPLGGNATVVFNTELRFPVAGFVKGAAFYDVGNVYPRVRDIFRTAPTHAFGAGVLLSTPVGPIRFDVGYNPDPPALPGFRHFNFHFTLGHPF